MPPLSAAITSEMSVNFYQTTRRNIPEDSHLLTRRRENLKSHLVLIYCNFPSVIKKLTYSISQVACDLYAGHSLLPKILVRTPLKYYIAALTL
jgi:hypothetical protein